MSFINVKNFFKNKNMDQKIIVFNESSATVKLAAKRLNCDENRIAKSLTFIVNHGPIMIVLSGEAKIDNAKYKSEFKEKAKMINKDDVLKLIGHDVGGVCPFAINRNVKVYLDESLKRFSIVYPACGSENSAIPLTIKELEEYSNSLKWIDVSKDLH
jgi:prolyl-tRNA editing enzyme YbaK/EbsC (Cys-tRNA(Pro) deacylase)